VDIAHETDAVRVVADDRIAVEHQRIDGSGQTRTRQQVVGELGSIDLEGHRHVEPAETGIAQRQRTLLEAVERGLDALIRNALMRLARKTLVDLR
jgi:hypothetical protein